MNPLSRLSYATILVGFLVAPLPTLAATNQQLLDQAFANLLTMQQNVVQGTVSYSENKTPLRKHVDASSENGRFTLFLQKDTSSTSTQGYFEAQAYTKVTAGQSTPALTTPVRIAFRALDHQLFLQLENAGTLFSSAGFTLPSEQVAQFQQWLKVDLTNDTNSPIPLSGLTTSLQASDLTNATSDLKQASAKHISAIKAISVKPVAKQPNLRRVQFVINPAFLNFFKQNELKAAGKDKVKRAAIIKNYADQQAAMHGVNLFATLDVSNKAHPLVTRVEISGAKTTTDKGCDYAKYQKNGDPVFESYSCELNSYHTKMTLNANIVLTRDANVHVVAPDQSVSLKDVLAKFFQDMLKTPGGDASSTQETTASTSTSPLTATDPGVGAAQ